MVTSFVTSFEEMMTNHEARFGVKVSDSQRQEIQKALKNNDTGAINRLTGLSTGYGDYECPISAWGIHGMTFEQADAELKRRVRQAVEQ